MIAVVVASLRSSDSQLAWRDRQSFINYTKMHVRIFKPIARRGGGDSTTTLEKKTLEVRDKGTLTAKQDNYSSEPALPRASQCICFSAGCSILMKDGIEIRPI